jgi:hypothetical protein
MFNFRIECSIPVRRSLGLFPRRTCSNLRGAYIRNKHCSGHGNAAGPSQPGTHILRVKSGGSKRTALQGAYNVRPILPAAPRLRANLHGWLPRRSLSPYRYGTYAAPQQNQPSPAGSPMPISVSCVTILFTAIWVSAKASPVSRT